MDRGNQTDGPLNLYCPCGCGIPVTTKKGIRYSDAKDDKQLARHFEGQRKASYRSRVKAKTDRNQRYAFACETASKTVSNPALKKDLLEIAEHFRK